MSAQPTASGDFVWQPSTDDVENAQGGTQRASHQLPWQTARASQDFICE